MFGGDLKRFLQALRIADRQLQLRLQLQQRNRVENIVPNNRNVLYLIIGALVVVLGVVGYNLYQEKKEPNGVQINIGPDGLKVQNK
ncbi:hypothetical protein RPC_2351 [Rhodopseudomonas palustris BisB18]|uniref:Uncharacterized protein n=2 Tax=Rhodopseudomonas palustris TaxID=1076 RepID=Q215N2_RHOPB